MTTYRITSPRSRTDRAANVLWNVLQPANGTGVTSSQMHLIDVVQYRVRKVRPQTKDAIDAALKRAGFAQLRWKEEVR